MGARSEPHSIDILLRHRKEDAGRRPFAVFFTMFCIWIDNLFDEFTEGLLELPMVLTETGYKIEGYGWSAQGQTDILIVGAWYQRAMRNWNFIA